MRYGANKVKTKQTLLMSYGSIRRYEVIRIFVRDAFYFSERGKHSA